MGASSAGVTDVINSWRDGGQFPKLTRYYCSTYITSLQSVRHTATATAVVVAGEIDRDPLLSAE